MLRGRAGGSSILGGVTNPHRASGARPILLLFQRQVKQIHRHWNQEEEYGHDDGDSRSGPQIYGPDEGGQHQYHDRDKNDAGERGKEDREQCNHSGSKQQGNVS
jgi:hypothetical protein